MCGNSAAAKVKSAPVSNDTIKGRINSTASDCAYQSIKIFRVPRISEFAIQLDESTTIADEVLLLVYVRFVHKGEISAKRPFVIFKLRSNYKREDIFALK